ncbi:hypothetical protein ACQEVS_04875 [Streptomyces sp. CA-181903]|uniref:hypothetical protein n=1 Tax=Streptomyces sp. CA-181903 TaxID=3240055 RepID=UPI003D8AC271
MKSIRTALCGTLTAVAVCAAPAAAYALEAPSVPSAGQVVKHGDHDRDHGDRDHGRDDDHGRDHDGRDDDHDRNKGRDHDDGWNEDRGRDGHDDHGKEDDHGRSHEGRDDDHGRDRDHGRDDDHGRDHGRDHEGRGHHEDHGRHHGDHDHGRDHHGRPHGPSHAGGGATAPVAAAESSSVDTPVLILAGATAGIAGGLIWSRRRASRTVKQ